MHPIMEELNKLRAGIDRIQALLEAEVSANPVELKKPNGRLTDEGVRILFAAFNSGAKPNEAAKLVDISKGAAWQHQKRWKAEYEKSRSGGREISPDKHSFTKPSCRLDVASFLAEQASKRRTVTYGELSDRFGRSPLSWGGILSDIATKTHKAGLPILSAIVVKAQTGLPSTNVRQYSDLGLNTVELIAAEQKKCFEFDWSGVFETDSPTTN